MSHRGGVSSRELFILGAVSARPTYGHEIMQTLRLSEAHRWVELSEKHVYYVLRKLARLGWVDERGRRDAAAPARKVYAITDAGRDALRQMLTDEALLRSRAFEPFDTALATLGTTDVLDDDDALAVLRARRDALRQRLADEHGDHHPDDVRARFGGAAWALASRSRRAQETEIAWIDEVIALVEREGWGVMRVPAGARPGGGPDPTD